MQESSSHSANSNSGALVVASAGGPQAQSHDKVEVKQARRGKIGATCLDGLWEILKHSEELRMRQPQVLGLAMQALAAMWQVCLSRCNLNVTCIDMTRLACHLAWLSDHVTWLLSPMPL